MKSEIQFLKGIQEYCDEMKDKVGRSILDDFNRIIIMRMKELRERKYSSTYPNKNEVKKDE